MWAENSEQAADMITVIGGASAFKLLATFRAMILCQKARQRSDHMGTVLISLLLKMGNFFSGQQPNNSFKADAFGAALTPTLVRGNVTFQHHITRPIEPLITDNKGAKAPFFIIIRCGQSTSVDQSPQP